MKIHEIPIANSLPAFWTLSSRRAPWPQKSLPLLVSPPCEIFAGLDSVTGSIRQGCASETGSNNACSSIGASEETRSRLVLKELFTSTTRCSHLLGKIRTQSRVFNSPGGPTSYFNASILLGCMICSGSSNHGQIGFDEINLGDVRDSLAYSPIPPFVARLNQPSPHDWIAFKVSSLLHLCVPRLRSRRSEPTGMWSLPCQNM